MRLTLILSLMLIVCGCVSDRLVDEDGGSSTSLMQEAESPGAVEGPSSSSIPVALDIPEGMGLKEPECGEIPDLNAKDECFYSRALNRKDRGVCEEIGNRHYRSRCRAEIDRDGVLCSRIGEVIHRDWCYRNVAFKSSDLELCYGIVDSDIADECIFTYLKHRRPNPFKCFDIKSSYMQDECMFYHVEIGRVNPELCFTIVNPGLELECNRTYLKPYLESGNFTQ